jgi:hypothetical protein
MPNILGRIVELSAASVLFEVYDGGCEFRADSWRLKDLNLRRDMVGQDHQINGGLKAPQVECQAQAKKKQDIGPQQAK